MDKKFINYLKKLTTTQIKSLCDELKIIKNSYNKIVAQENSIFEQDLKKVSHQLFLCKNILNLRTPVQENLESDNLTL